MIGRALGDGIRGATRRPGLVALLWAWNLALALLATVPFWTWIGGASVRSPETDTLLDGADLGIITQLVQASPGLLPGLIAGVAALGLLSLLSGAFLSGGILEVVMNAGDDRPLLHRFFRGAGHFFGRFVRLLAIAAVTGLLVVGLVSAAVSFAMRPLATGGSEPAAAAATLVVPAVVFLAIAFFWLALDYARVIVVARDTRGMLRAWLRGLAFVVRHLPSVAIIGILAGLGVAATIAALAAYDVAYSARAWSVIAGAILLQQAMAFARSAVRVGQVNAQATYCAGLMDEADQRRAADEMAANEDVRPATAALTNEDVRPTTAALTNGDVRPTTAALANGDVRPTTAALANEDVRLSTVVGDQAQQKG